MKPKLINIPEEHIEQLKIQAVHAKMSFSKYLTHIIVSAVEKKPKKTI
jgi:hypothetical protein